jgi:hypothetical protein
MSYALIDLQIEGDVITVTPEHPFQVAGRGWVSANDLEIGDQVSSERSAPLRIESKITRQECTRVFNFQVENTHTYLIGRDGVVVHNSCAWTTRAASLPKGVPGIYIIKTPRGDKYVGQATDLAERLSDSAHKHAALIRDPANELYTIGLNTTKWKGSVRDGIDMAEEFYIRALGAKGGSSNPSGLNRRFEVNQADLEKLVNQFGFPDLNAPTSH